MWNMCAWVQVRGQLSEVSCFLPLWHLDISRRLWFCKASPFKRGVIWWPQNIKQLRAGKMAQVVRYLQSKHEALSSDPQYPDKKKKKPGSCSGLPVIPVLGRQRRRISHPTPNKVGSDWGRYPHWPLTYIQTQTHSSAQEPVCTSVHTHMNTSIHHTENNHKNSCLLAPFPSFSLSCS